MSDSAPCPACGAGELRYWREARTADRRASAERYTLLRCAGCGTAVTAGATADDARALHRGGVYGRPPRRVDAVLEPLRRLATRSALRAIGDLPPGAAVCDVGAGDGRLVDALRGRGCYAVGLDPFAGDAPPAVATVPIEEAGLSPATFDAVVFWHVLEHLDQPAAALGEAVRALKASGRVVASVPNLDSLQARLGGDLWFHQDVPRHRIHFSRAGLRLLLERCGLGVERLDTVCVDQDLLGMTQTLLNRLTGEPNVAFRALKRDREAVRGRSLALSAVGLTPAAVLGSIVEGGAMLTGRGGSLVARARVG